MADEFDPFLLLLRHLERHSPLTEADRAAVRQLPFRRRQLKPDAYIVREGEPADSCAVLVSGFTYRQKLTATGSRQIVSIQIPGDALDFQSVYLEFTDHSVQALTRVDIAAVPRIELQALLRERPAVTRAVFVAVLIEASIFREWIVNVGRRNSRTAMAHLLCEFAARLEAQGLVEDYSYELPITQEQLGDALGLTSVHVNRTLRALEADGLIRRDKRRISFPDWSKLRRIGDFSQHYLHLDQTSGEARDRRDF